MAKLVLNALASLSNETSAINAINENSTAIEVALENTLSRDGTTPNAMAGDLDLNSNRAINSAQPVDDADLTTKLYVDDLFGTSDPVTLTSDLDYLTLTGKALTASAIVLTTDVSGVLPGANGGNLGINVKTHGATGDGSTDDTAAIQAAIDAANTAGGVKVFFPEGTYITTKLTLKSGVILSGSGINSTILKLKDATNDTLIQSLNYSTLTGTNKWLTSDGVQHGLGLEDLQLDGNKANQTTAGVGVQFYAKRIFIKNVIIRDCYGVGWYSEAGDVVGQTDWTDIPESRIESLWLRNNGSHGFQFRGPHDADIVSIGSNENGGDGVIIEHSTNTYNGSSDIGFIHTYANTGYGVNVPDATCQFRARQIISESNHKEGLVLGGTRCQISMLQLYNNCRTSGTYNATVTGTFNTIDNLQSKTGTDATNTSGLSVTGDSNQISNILIEGEGSTGTGVVCGTSSYSKLQGRVTSFNGAGGVGISTNDTSVNYSCTFDFEIDDCTTLWNNDGIGVRNKYRMGGFSGAGQSVFSGTAPNTSNSSEIWECTFSENGILKLSEVRKKSGATINLNSTTEQTISIGHELLATPEPEAVSFDIYYAGTNTTWELQYITLFQVQATQIDFKVKLATAAGAAETGNIIMHVAL